MLFLYPEGGINIVTAIKESKAYKYCKLCIRKDYDKGAEVLQNQEESGIIEEVEEKRFNPYHDPRNGRFTSGSGGVDNFENSVIMNTEKGIDGMPIKEATEHFAAGNRRSPYYVLNDDDIKTVNQEIEAIGADKDYFVFNSSSVKGTCFLVSDGKVYIKGNIFPDEYSDHPRDKMSIRAVLAHEYYGHRPYRNQYLREDNETSPEALNRIFANAWADEFRASYMAAKNAPNLSEEDRRYLIMDSLSRAKEAGVKIKYNDFIRRVLYG